MTAYADPFRSGMVIYVDMFNSEAAGMVNDRWGAQLQVGQYIALLLIGSSKVPSPVFEALAERGVDARFAEDQKKGRTVLAAEVPYVVQHHEVDAVFDLRRIKARAFVVDEFFK